MDTVLVESNTLRKVFKLTIDGNPTAAPHEEVHLPGVAQARVHSCLISIRGISVRPLAVQVYDFESSTENTHCIPDECTRLA